MPVPHDRFSVAGLGRIYKSSGPNGRVGASVAEPPATAEALRPSQIPHGVHRIAAQIDPDERTCRRCGRPALFLIGGLLCPACSEDEP
jgi:hypothetical protein